MCFPRGYAVEKKSDGWKEDKQKEMVSTIVRRPPRLPNVRHEPTQDESRCKKNGKNRREQDKVKQSRKKK